MARIQFLKATVVTALLSACSHSTPLPPAVLPVSSQNAAVLNAPVFRPGDKLELYVEEDPSFNASYVVRPGGYILIPKVGRIQIEGMSRDAAESALTYALQKSQLTKAKVLVEHVSGNYDRPGPPGIPKIMIFITGSANRTGAHYLPVTNGNAVGIYEALLVTGGLSKFGQIGNVEVFRNDAQGRRVRSVIDLRPIRDGKVADPSISEGDIINIREKVFGF